MALTKTTVTGRLPLPNDMVLPYGNVQFALRRLDVDKASNDVLMPVPVSAGIGADGKFSIDLWPNERGERGTVYSVSAHLGARPSGKGPVVEMGVIVVPPTGPVDISDLLQIPAPVPTAPDVLAQVLAAEAQAKTYADSTSGDAERAEAAAKLAEGYAGGIVPNFSDRDGLVEYIQSTSLAEGTEIRANGLSYAWQQGATAIPDMPNVVPSGPAFPEHLGAVGDGVADDSAVLATWAAAGGKQSLRPGAVYRLATRRELIWPLNTDADLSAGVIRQEYIETSNNAFGQLYGRIKGLRWQFANGAHMQRGLSLWPGSSCTDFEVRADADFPRNNDVRDGLFIVRGAGVTIKRGLFDGIYNPIQFYQDDNSAGTQIADIDFMRYGDGVSVRSGISPNVVLQNLRYHSINANAATDPGKNTVTGGSAYMTVSGIRHVTNLRGSGEHFLYSGVPDGTRGCDFSQVFSHSSGQCFMKFRGHADFRLSDCHGEGTSAENSIGTNEDGFRFENCRGLVASNISIRRREGAGPGGNDGLNLNNSWNMLFSGLVFEYQTRASIYLCTPPSTTYAQSPNQAVENININGMLCRVMDASKPFIMLGDDDGATTTTCKVGNITISGLDWDGDPANLVTVKAGITRQAVTGSEIRISGTIKGRPFSYVWAAAATSGTLTWLAA